LKQCLSLDMATFSFKSNSGPFSRRCGLLDGPDLLPSLHAWSAQPCHAHSRFRRLANTV
jgi:hypothetical protein